MYVFEIPGNPVAWKRAGRNGRKSFDLQKKEKEHIGWCFRIAHKGIYLASGPLSLHMEYHMTTPASWSLTKRLNAFSKYHTSKPDIDNLVKIILDGLNGVAWADDAQVSEVYAKKIYSETPKSVIKIKLYKDFMFNNDQEKTLIVYAHDSHSKYYELYSLHTYEVKENGHLIIHERDKYTGEEHTRAHFATWDYFIIE